jgi:hypothetical protein
MIVLLVNKQMRLTRNEEMRLYGVAFSGVIGVALVCGPSRSHLFIRLVQNRVLFDQGWQE